MELLNKTLNLLTKKELDVVYVDNKKGGYIHIRDAFKDKVIVGMSEYYSDSKTTNVTVPISRRYINDNCTKVKDIMDSATFKYGFWKAKR